MRPPFRSVSFPSLRQWGALLPPKKAKRLQRDCTSLRPSCWPLHLVGKCSLAPLARSWLGRLAFARLPPLSARSARSRQRLCLPWLRSDRPPWSVRPPLAVTLAPLVRSPFHSEKKRYFREKRAFEANAHFSRKWNVWFFLRIHSEKT